MSFLHQEHTDIGEVIYSFDRKNDFPYSFDYKRIHVPTGKESIETVYTLSNRHFMALIRRWNRGEVWSYVPVREGATS